MANPEHVKIVRRGKEAIREWRDRNKVIPLDLGSADLSNADLAGADLSNTHLMGSDLLVANLDGADLIHADLMDANLNHAFLRGADLEGADLIRTDLTGAFLAEANFANAICASTVFVEVDLSSVKGLETVVHDGPSMISLDTLYRSGGKIPEAFLRGCDVPEEFIRFLPDLFVQPIQFYSCFISYSHKDEDFARRLHSRMRAANLRVWYAPEDMKGGEKLHEQIDRAIQLHDRLLLVLSENSLQSEWVMTEIRKARKAERKENRRKLFPIRLVPFDRLLDWECFDADSGKDLGVEVREYFVPDFSNWKDQDAFEVAFARLLADLRAAEAKAAGDWGGSAE